MFSLLHRRRRSGFYSITRYRKNNPAHFEADLKPLCTLLRQGSIVPRIADTLSLKDAVRHTGGWTQVAGPVN